MLDAAVLNLLEARHRPLTAMWLFPATTSETGYAALDALLEPWKDLSKNEVVEPISPQTHQQNGDKGQSFTKIAPSDLAFQSRELSRGVVRRIKQHLRDDISETINSGDAVNNWIAVRAGLSLARHIAPYIIWSPDVKFAAFTEENGVVALVLESARTDRRLTCRFSKDGFVGVHRINESMESSFNRLAAGQESPQELAEWVTARAIPGI